MSAKLVAMILAGGKGTRLKALTRKVAKPAVEYGGKYRIIDFPLSNCANSGIRTVSVLTQYESSELNTYVGNGEKWGLNGVRSMASILSPKQTEEGSNWYAGTADAIYENLDWLAAQNPDYVLILSGDHIYSCTYNEMLKKHIDSGADCTISAYPVDWKEASRFGLIIANEKDEITSFQEKPKNPLSNLASMGIYIFTYSVLREYLLKDHLLEKSDHDFGKNIIPTMLSDGKKLVTYTYHGYWRDVGTISSLHKANMDLLLSNKDGTNLYTVQGENKILSEDKHSVPQYIGPKAKVKDSLVNQGAQVYGVVEHSVISGETLIEEGAHVKNSVIMSGARIAKGAKVLNAIVAPGTLVEDKEKIQPEEGEEIALIANKKARLF